jgi:FkbM family methyltransferase
MSSRAHTPDSASAAPRFLPVHGRWRAYDRFKQAIKRLSPEWFIRTVQAALEPYSRARRSADHRQRIQANLPDALHERMLAMYDEARSRWNQGERAPTGPLMELPLGRFPQRVWLRPGTCDVILYDDIVVQEQYGSLPLENVRTIVDGGANIGLASAYFLSRSPRARVLAIEPDPVNHELCMRNLTAFGERAVVLRAGLWSRPCRIQVESANQGTWASTTAPADAAAGTETIEAFDVPTLLDRYGIETLDLLKIDIEGAEREIFSAADLGWLDRVGCIQIELEPASRETFFRAVAGHGYEFVQHREVTVAARPDWNR